MELETMTDVDLLKKHRLDSRFKSLDDVFAFVAQADAGLKERDTYKGQTKKLNDWARENGFSSFKEMQEAALASKKAPNTNGTANYRDAIAKKHREMFGDEVHNGIMKEQPRLFEFLEAIINEAVSPLRNNDMLQKIVDAVDEGFDHRQEMSYLLSLPEAERMKRAPLMSQLRKIYKDEKLYDIPEDADDKYMPYGVAWERYLKNLEAAGLKLPGTEPEKKEIAPVRRIAFTGQPKEGASEEKNSRSPFFASSKEEFPEMYNPDGSLKEEVWKEGLGIKEGEEEGVEE